MYNAAKGTEHPLRTFAQSCAVDNDYEYDVRTCIDGFPIVMFYQLTESEPLTFMGKYNFNNDKSNESVFGFEDIPGFDDTEIDASTLVDGKYVEYSYDEGEGVIKDVIANKYKNSEDKR